MKGPQFKSVVKAVLLAVVCARDAVERSGGDGDDLLALEGRGDLPGPADVVVGAVAEAVVVALAPREHEAGPRQRHRELRAALNLDGACKVQSGRMQTLIWPFPH